MAYAETTKVPVAQTRAEIEAVRLTDAQRDFLRWLATQPIHSVEWMRHGKRVGPLAQWPTHLKVVGSTSFWVIEVGQLAGICDFYGRAEFGSGGIIALTDAGRAALAEQEKGDA